ncbi:MAG: hypothetical protein HQK54_06925, partial [Oligoflexales bacterium]|nr:hypothetical protein [Oligoflexales bacterium]
MKSLNIAEFLWILFISIGLSFLIGSSCDRAISLENNDTSNLSKFPSSALPAKNVSDLTVLVSAGMEKYDLGKNVEYFEDKAGTVTYDDIQSKKINILWKKSMWDVPNFGYTGSTYWLKFKIKPDPKLEKNWYLEVGYPLLNEIEFYYTGLDGLVKASRGGNLFPFKERELDYINTVFPLTLENPDGETFYLKIKSSGSIQIPLFLWSLKKFAVEKKHEYAAQFLYNGIILVMILYNLLLAISSGNMNFVYYVLY